MSVAPRVALPALTSLRFPAALLVFLFHARQFFGGTDGQGIAEAVGGNGNAGVAFFFVLSGFVLTWVHPSLTGRGNFYLKRFARIWPLHALTWAVAVALSLVAVGDPVETGPGIASLVLVQAWSTDPAYPIAANGVSWTLSCEAFFYALFPLLVGRLAALGPRGRRFVLGGALAAAFAIAIQANSAPLDSAQVWLSYFSPLGRLPEFVLGICLAFGVRDRTLPQVRPSVAVGWVAVVFVVLAFDVPRASHVLVVPAFALLIVACVQYDLAGAWWLHHPRLLMLGRWSFAFYLVHQGIVNGTDRAMRHFVEPDVLWALAGSAFSLLAALVLAGTLHRVVETPAQRWLTARSRASAPA